MAATAAARVEARAEEMKVETVARIDELALVLHTAIQQLAAMRSVVKAGWPARQSG